MTARSIISHGNPASFCAGRYIYSGLLYYFISNRLSIMIYLDADCAGTGRFNCLYLQPLPDFS
jgi:hypothetical protein